MQSSHGEFPPPSTWRRRLIAAPKKQSCAPKGRHGPHGTGTSKLSKPNLRAAAAHEQAAMTVGEQQCDLHQSAAERHRAAAAFHEATITESTSIKPPDDPSVDFLHQQ
ncbi:MAG: hypothetical protein JWR34_6006 [Mycobacterium sp.]|nr:hypothetical protein [Mycobacterium sp.]